MMLLSHEYRYSSVLNNRDGNHALSGYNERRAPS